MIVTHKFKKTVEFKDGTTVPEGTPADIQMKEGSHHVVLATIFKGTEKQQTLKLSILKMHRWFNEFDPVTEDDIQEAQMDGDNYSIYNLSECGNLEPDGSDEFGFPSKVLAIM